MSVRWSPQAIGDLASIREFIERDDPGAARGVVLQVIAYVSKMLPAHPQAGRPGRVPGTRELVVPRSAYIVPYRVRRGDVEILRVYHAARRWPDRM
jgi:toxin ParE1/3/4